MSVVVLAKIIIEIKPFYLYAMSEEEAHLCPVCALAEWIDASKIQSGYLFRKIASGDHVSEQDGALVYVFLFQFSNSYSH